MLELKQINDMKAWQIIRQKCPGCHETATRFYRWSPRFFECDKCCERRVDKTLSQVDVSHWQLPRFLHEMSPMGTMVNRLLALKNTRHFSGARELPQLIANNLGYEDSHPLSAMARRLAGEAAVNFGDQKIMLGKLLTIRKYVSWLHKVNVVKTVHELAPEDAGVKKLIVSMSRDASPGVRRYLAPLLWKSKGAWTKKIFRELERDLNPLVREACSDARRVVSPGNRIRNIRKPLPRLEKKDITKSADTVKTKVPRYSAMEKNVYRYYDFPLADQAYERYLKPLVEKLDKKKWPLKKRKALQTNCEESQIRLLAAILKSRPLFQQLFAQLPPEARALLYLCIHEGEFHDLQVVDNKIQQLLDMDGTTPSAQKKQKGQKKHTAVNDFTQPAFFLFQIRESWSDFYKDKRRKGIELNRGLRDVIVPLVPQNVFQGPRALPAPDPEKFCIHEDNDSVFQVLPVIMAYISQDQLKYAKNGETILKSSFKKMAEACGIREFYQDAHSDFKWLKTALLAEFFTCGLTVRDKELKDVPQFIKNRMNAYFAFKDFKGFRYRNFAHYIRQKEGRYDTDRTEKKLRRSIKKVISLLPAGKWVSPHHLALAAFHNGMDLDPFFNSAEWKLYFKSDFFPGSTDFDAGEAARRLPLRSSYKFDAVVLPLVKGFLFLMAALGVVDAAFTAPENNCYRQQGKKWLSIYDGLARVRLTKFGGYVTGKKKAFKADVSIESATIETDPEKTMISLYGEDPIKHLALAHVGERINTSTYMVNYQSFLRDCQRPMDVENKIRFFREHIDPSPPPVWEDFFKAVTARMDPMTTVSDFSVFQVKQNRELLTLLTTDPVLKSNVVKAENFHVLVETSRLALVKKRLAEFGFFLSD